MKATPSNERRQGRQRRERRERVATQISNQKKARLSSIEIFRLDGEGLGQHLDAIAEILHACVHDGANVGFVLPFDLNQARAFWAEKIAPGLVANSRIVLVAKVNNQVAGTVQLNLDTPPNQPHRADVSKLLVHPKYRKLGIGRALMEQIESYAENDGRRLLTLDTATDIAENLYLSLGYERAGHIPGYARDPNEDRFVGTTIMYKVLPGSLRLVRPSAYV
ncbi:MAG: GNAT family N-acetyltransferase [Verrucomicrobia bacterium]|nr:GNAT family N-acetyltransferase [Verrucomicrobiota bacterium]